MKLSQLKPNSSNPRRISEAKLQKLKTSIESFEQMMEARPMIVNADMEILGGNMRYRALNALGYDEIPDNWVKQMDFTPEQEREFIIKDNVGFGEWDWDVLANEWETQDLGEWGLDVWQHEQELDYSILDEDDSLDGQLQDMTDGVKKAIQIEFEAEHYEEAFELVKFWRQQRLYIGGFLMEKLKAEKEKYND